MNNLDLDEVLNKEISDLVDLMHHAIKVIGKQYDLNNDQLSKIERDFIARLAFAAIKYGVNKEEEEDCESCPANDHCSFKESEKKTVPVVVWKCLNYVKDYCKERECDGCVFNEDDQCKIKYTPNKWKV